MIKPHKKFIHDELKAAGLDTENSLHIIQNYKIIGEYRKKLYF